MNKVYLLDIKCFQAIFLKAAILFSYLLAFAVFPVTGADMACNAVSFRTEAGRFVMNFNQSTNPVQLKGRVTDVNGEPLPGATVYIKGTQTGVATDISGGFSILVESGSILSVTYAGFEKKEIAVNNKTFLVIELKPVSSHLGEVVVTALGIKRQERSLGYSTTQIAGASLTESRTPNLATALSGQVAGVSVAGTGTGPNGSTRITIRGNTSLTAGKTPLYIIDGVPFETTNQGQSGQYGGQDSGDLLSTINPDDIESINVLKGVAASALYGYRGGNGVILITTKSGSTKKGIGIEINNNTTMSQVIDYRDYQYVYGQGSNGKKPTTVADILNTEYSSWGAPIDGSMVVNILGKQVPYSSHKDNYKNFYSTGVNSQSSVSLSGKNDNGSFRLGLSNANSKEIIPLSGSSQQGINFNSSYNLTSKLHLAFMANYVNELVKNRPSYSDAPGSLIATTNYLANTYDIRSLKQAVLPNGSEQLPGTDLYFDNPYFIAHYFKNTTERNRYTGNITLKYDLTNWMSIQGQINRNSFTNDQSNITPTGTSWSPPGFLSVSSNTDREINASFLLDINKKLGKNFAIHANIGANHQDNTYKSAGTSGSVNIPGVYSVNNLLTFPYNIGFSESKVNSVYAATDLSFKNYLFLTLTGRNDWFSVLNPKSDSYFYPSVASSFVFSDAFKLPDWITFGKIRASYAQSSGAGDTNPYQLNLTYTNNQAIVYNGLLFTNINQSVVPNQLLKPLSISETELGLNMAFLNGRISIDAAVYNKLTKNDILNVTSSDASGYTGAIENVGKLRNRGLELLLSGYPVRTGSFSWKSALNFATNSSKVLYLSPGATNLQLGTPARWGTFSINQIVGKQYGQLVGYRYQRDKSGNKIFDDSGLPVRTNDLEPMGSGVYRVTGGFSNEFRYKNFNLSVLLDYKFGAKIYSVTNSVLYANGLSKQTLAGRVGGYIGKGVKADGTPNTTAVPSQVYFGAISGAGSATDDIAEEFVYDASFIKLRNISFGYTFNEAALKHTPFKSLTFSIVGRNLAILLKHTPNVDPESNLTSDTNQGVEYNAYPPIRNIGFNINVKF